MSIVFIFNGFEDSFLHFSMDLVSVFVRILEMITIIRKQNVLINGISPIDMVSMASGHVCDMNVFEVHTFTNIDLYYDR